MPTPLQMAMLKRIARDELTPVNGREPDNASDATTYAELALDVETRSKEI